MSCKAVMYHYVRPTDISQPHLFYLNLDDFRRQLDHFEQTFGIVNQAEWQAALTDPRALPDGVILTFDDGLIDHYRYVWPELRARGLWGIFYVSSATLQAQHLLSVHRVHYLLGRFGGARVLNALEMLLDDSLFIDGFFKHLQATPYAMQSMDKHSLRVKKIVNYGLRPECKDKVLGKLFYQLAGDESAVAQQFYMNSTQIREMADDGFTFGAHGESHNLLSKFNGADLTREVADSVEVINSTLAYPSDTFCYPFGGPDSWSDQVLIELKQQSIRYCFCVESADVTVADLQQRPLCLPRYDCNEFLFGKARIAQ